MSRSNDAGHFFQTSDALATTERKTAKANNKHGNPIKLPSKILAAIVAPLGDSIYVAEAAGEVKRVLLETGETHKIFSLASGPLTCLAASLTADQVFAGSWDKSIYHVNPFTKRGTGKSFQGHTDFVKCLLTTTLGDIPILVSGGADAAIIVWNIETGKQLHKLKGHTKSLQDLAIDPLSIPEGVAAPPDHFILFSASSDREIRRWRISVDTASELPESIEKPILAHETSVYKVCFDSDGDLWTASADKTAKHLVRSRGWEADTTLRHPDFVRDVVVSEEIGVVATACRDEEVRVWDLASGDLVCTYSGHFEEVTGLVVMAKTVVSVSIDGTLRRWGLERNDMLAYEEQLKKEVVGDGGGEEEKKGGSDLTAEEEAELAEMMDESD